MNFLKRSALICKLLFVSLLVSVLATSSANNFTYGHFEDPSVSLINASLLDCSSAKGAGNTQIEKFACARLAANIVGEAKKTDSCCCAINVLALFPATQLVELKKFLRPSLVLIRKKQTIKTYAFTELIYRPPINNIYS